MGPMMNRGRLPPEVEQFVAYVTLVAFLAALFLLLYGLAKFVNFI